MDVALELFLVYRLESCLSRIQHSKSILLFYFLVVVFYLFIIMFECIYLSKKKNVWVHKHQYTYALVYFLSCIEE
jgi:hypothetical protein